MTEKIRRFIKNVLRADAFKSVVSLFLLNQFQASLAVRHLPFAHSSRIPPAFLPHSSRIPISISGVSLLVGPLPFFLSKILDTPPSRNLLIQF